MRLFYLVLLLLLLIPIHAQGQQPDAVVKRMATTLNLRDAPSPVGNVVTQLTSGTPLDIIGRTVDNNWLKVQTPDGQMGWVAAGYVDVNIDLAGVAVTTNSPSSSTTQPPAVAIDQPAVTNTDGADGLTNTASLNLRAHPTTTGAIVARLPNGTPLTIIGRNVGSHWLQVRTDEGQEGWVYGYYVNLNIDLNGVPVTGGGDPAPANLTTVVSNITGNSRTIFLRGQRLGNRVNVFSKVGDSISVSEQVYDPIGRGVYNLGDYLYLQGVINYFSKETARDHNSFVNNSMAARVGWTTATVLDPKWADTSLCEPDERPLVCEYRLTKPAVALIMLGSNDVHFIDAGTYRANLDFITRTSIEMGIIPVLSTIPPRIGYEEQVNRFNTIIRELSQAHNVPLWDYYSVMAGLPNSGLSGDGLHPSISPRGYAGAADFTGDNLSYGYVIRNLTALQVLDALWRNVLSK